MAGSLSILVRLSKSGNLLINIGLTDQLSICSTWFRNAFESVTSSPIMSLSKQSSSDLVQLHESAEPMGVIDSPVSIIKASRRESL